VREIESETMEQEGVSSVGFDDAAHAELAPIEGVSFTQSLELIVGH